jgi:HEAT repeat protein
MPNARKLWNNIAAIAALLFLFAAPSLAQSNLDHLKDQITDGSVEDKRDALFIIRNLHSEEASRIAVAALTDTDEVVRASAAVAVISLPGRRAAALIIPLLNDEAEFVRIEAAFALGELGAVVDAVRAAGVLTDLAIGDAVRPALVRTLEHDKSVRVRSAAAVALGHGAYGFGIDVLTAVLKTKPREEDEYLRRAAARSIGQIVKIERTGKPEIITPQNFLADKYKSNYWGPESTMVYWSSDTVDTLIKVVKDAKEAEDTRREAAFALGNLYAHSSVPALRACLTSPDPYLAETCKEALIKLDAYQ